MKVILIVALLLVSLDAYNQKKHYQGKTIDSISGEPLPFVNIGIVGKNIGTVSDINGDFQIELNEKFDKDTLKISMVGYKSLAGRVSDFKKRLLEHPTVEMKEDPVVLNEVIVGHKKLKKKNLGTKPLTSSTNFRFISNKLGTELAVKINIKRQPTYIISFNALIAKNKHDSVKLRLNFYDVKDGLPGKHILKENIITVCTMKRGKLTIDLSEYNIEVDEDFFVSLEWLENLGKKGLYFSSKLGNNTFVRYTSQGNWTKVGIVSVGFYVTAEY